MFGRLERKIILFQILIKSVPKIPWQCAKRMSGKFAIKFNRAKHTSAKTIW